MPKVLIVDDEPLMHLLYKNHLERAGYQLLTAKDGSEVFEIASRELPQVIVMDVFMAQMDGLAALRELKKSPVTQAIPVIIITSNVKVHYAARKESAISGAALFLTKPFGPAQLLEAIHKVVPPQQPEPSPPQP